MKPRAFVERHARGLTPGRALDLACGSGGNAVWLAERGWDVTAVDRSIEEIAALQIPGIHAVAADLERHEFQIGEGQWDLIVVSYYLQRDLFPRIIRGLKPGGVAIVIVHMFEPGHEQSRFSVEPGELRQAFAGQRILAYEEGKPPENPNGRATARIAFQAS